MKKELRWDDIQIGEELGPLEYDISEDFINNFANAVDDHDDWYMKSSPFGDRIAHPTFAATDYNDLAFLTWGPLLSGLHAKHSMELINPVKAGSTVKVSGKIVNKYIKRERKYIEMEYQVVDQDGQEIARHKYTGTVPQ